MNIIEAVRSGKRFKREGGNYWYEQPEGRGFTTDEILATDWEIEERKIEITESEFDDAVEATRQRPLPMWFEDQLKKRLFEKGAE